MALRADDVDLGRDRDLVVRTQSGDADAFEDLYRRYFDRLYRFCLRRVGDPHEAEELTQETFARAYRALPRLDGERRFYPWLSVIASRLCVDEFRRRSRTEPTAVIDLGGSDGGQERVLHALDVALLGRAMTRLTPRHQDVLRLRENEGWSYQHIADHMGVNLGTVEALLHRARRALRREFDVLSGPETVPAVVGGGILARAFRRLGTLRHRLAACENGWAPLLGNAVAAVAIVVSVIAAGPSAPTAPTRLPMSPVAAVSDAASTTPGDGAGTAGTAAGATHRGRTTSDTGRESSRDGSDGPLPLSPSAVAGEVTGKLPGGVPQGDGDRGRSEDQPVVEQVEGLTVGADPDVVIDDSQDTVGGWSDWTTEDSP